MKGTIYFVAIAIIFAFALGDVFATKPGDEFQSNRLVIAGEAAPIDEEIMDTGCHCVDQWPIEKCETAVQNGTCSVNGIANNCLKTCGWCCDSNPACCDNVDGGIFSDCNNQWCLQQGQNKPQYTKCESVTNNGDTCINPQIKYGSVEGGIPVDGIDTMNIRGVHKWCNQLGGAYDSHTSGSLGDPTSSRTGFCVVGSSKYDDDVWHWGDCADGYWYNATLDSYRVNYYAYITSITCKDVVPCPAKNQTMVGNDIGMQIENIGSWEECGLLCYNNASCKYWSWKLLYLVMDAPVFGCQLKYANPGLTYMEGVISGGKNCTTECPKICSFIIDPVCGSDGITYQNICLLEMEKCKEKPDLTVAYAGECKEQDCYDNYIGDGLCDDVNNNPGCEFDGGDCCGPSVNTTYCTECMCKECGGEVSGPSGSLQSPNWPEMYPANTSCLWNINCEDGGKPNVSVFWGDLVNNVVWSENAGCSDFWTPQISVMTEPYCPPPMRSFDTLRGMLRMNRFEPGHPGHMILMSNGYIGFESNPYSMGGMGFEIKYQCPVKEPCEDIKSTKFCKKQKKKGKCKKASIWKKCKLTCNKCD